MDHSIIHGSGIGPSLFYSTDLKTLSTCSILKYADDTSILVQQYSAITLKDEFSHLLDWSLENKLEVNNSKTKEIVFHLSITSTYLPLSITWCWSSWLRQDVRCFPTSHLSAVLTVCNQQLYLLSQLKYSLQALTIVFDTLIFSKITYALPAFAGHISVSDKKQDQ